MDENTLNDLKQFISTTVSQQLSQQTEELRKEIARVEQKVDDLSIAVGTPWTTPTKPPKTASTPTKTASHT
jgi:hypothetical protein